MDPELRDLIIGRVVPNSHIQRAVLPGHRCVAIPGRGYPTIVSDLCSHVSGCLVHGIDELAAARLNYYEAEEFEPEIGEVKLESGKFAEAWVFLFEGDAPTATEDWQLENWQRKYKRKSLSEARAVMMDIDQPELDRLERIWRSALQ